MSYNDFDWTRFVPPEPPQPPDAIILPTLEPKPNDDAPPGHHTRHFGLWHRIAAIWCRAFGDDHSPGLRRILGRIIERARSNRDDE